MNACCRWLFVSLALFAFAGDQASKYGVFSWLHNQGAGGKYEIFNGYFCIDVAYEAGGHQPRVNKGALFGLGHEHQNRSNLFFAGVSVLAAAFILVWGLRKSIQKDWLLTSALGLILGGTLGNLYDRIVFSGVRDFLYLYNPIDWPVFNFADSCLVVGASLLLFQALFLHGGEEKKVVETAPAPAPSGTPA